jgi:eukaryotic-like serine/threonine-protein kinase
MPVAPDLVGSALDGRYELHELIGEGAFGRVYRGLDRRLHREVAVKVIKPWWAEDSVWVERFEREARLLARVSDPGIVQIFDIGHAEQGPYYVAELVAGESLAERLSRGPMSVAEALRVSEQLCRALASAHSRGVVHCDVKPANVLLTKDGSVKVGDFGVARLAGGTSQALSATVAGTPRYMSPEQARGRSTDAATDVYSAGVVLYEMLAGRPPFLDGSAVELGLRHVQEQPPPLPERVPPAVRALVERALRKEPAGRYRDGAEMAGALHAIDRSVGSAGSAAAPEPSNADASDTSASDAEAGNAGAGETDAKPSERGEHATKVLGAEQPPTRALIPSQARRTPKPPRAGAPGASAQRGSNDPPAPPGSSATVPALPPEAPRNRAVRRRGVAALLIALALLIGLVLLLVLDVFAPARTTVPHLRGLPRAGVQARARRLHVRVVFASRHSESAVAGIAIAQAPAPGARVSEGSTVHVTLSAGPPPVNVPGVVGQPASSAGSSLAKAGLRYSATSVPAPGSKPGIVTRQSPQPGTSAPHGSTVALSVAETPRWRTLTTFSGVDDGHSVPFRIEGSQWRVTYSMSYEGSCLLLLVCFGPSAKASNLKNGQSFDGFDLSPGSSHAHVFDSGPGLYRVNVNGGEDSARWAMTVQDYY